MKHKRIVLLGAGFLLLALGLWYVFFYEPPTFVPTQVSLEYSRRQVLGQLEPGWNLRSVSRNTERVRTLVHKVEVSDEIAGEILLMSRGERRRRVGDVACPDAGDPIWEQLEQSQDVVVQLSTAKGPFESVSCRAAVF